MSLVLSEPTNPLEVRMARLEGSYEQIDKRLSTLEARLENGFNDLRAEIRLTDAKIDKLEQKMDAKFDKLDRKIDARFSLIVLLGGVMVVLQVLSALGII